MLRTFARFCGTILWAWPTLPRTYQTRVLQRCRLHRGQAHQSWIKARTPSSTRLSRQLCEFLISQHCHIQVRVAHICNETAPAAPPPAFAMKPLTRTHTVYPSPFTCCHTNSLPKSRSQLSLVHLSQPVRYCSASTDVRAYERSSTRRRRCAAPAPCMSCSWYATELISAEFWQNLCSQLRTTPRLVQLPLVHMRTLLVVYLSDSDPLLSEITRCFCFSCRARFAS